ncbi:MAG: YCF48-related protein [Patescibacteria group bacterium]|nr:YCF48-related protein [Patescibacteria group bacterium]
MFNKTITIIVATALGVLMLTGLSCGSKKSTNDGGVYKTVDGGQTWQQKGFVEVVKKKTITINNVDTRQLIFDPNEAQIIYLATNDRGLYKTVNSGDEWKKTGLDSGQITSVAIDPKDTKVIYATSGRYLYKSQDSGDHWDTVYRETRAEGKLYNVLVDTFDSNRIYLSNDTGGLFKSFDQGQNWQQIYWFKKPIKFIKINPVDTRRIFVSVDATGLFFSEDGGNTWLSLEEGLKNFKGAGKNVHSLCFDPVSTEILYVGTNYGLLKSTDEGKTWEAIKTLINFGSQPITLVSINPQNSKIIYHATKTAIYRSSDGGFTWASLTPLPTKRNITQLLINPEQPEIMFAGVIYVKS